VGQTDVVGARRQQALVYPVMAEVALHCNSGRFFTGDGVIRAGRKAGAAADTFVLSQYYNAVFPFADSFFRAGCNARRFFAMTAAVGGKDKMPFTVYLSRPVFPDLKELYTFGSVVLLLARHLAGLAAPALFFDNFQSHRGLL
jgi:hypothetical protein